MQKGATENRFRSRSEHNLDEKGRLNIPSRFRDVLRRNAPETLMITNWHNCLKAYPVQTWGIIENKLMKEAKNQAGMAPFVRYVISGLTECPLDKQGRILLPLSLRTGFAIKKEVVLNGMLDHFEIWDREAWETEAQRARDNFQNFDLAALGIL